MPIFRVKSVKIKLAKKNLHWYIRGIRDKYEVCHGTHLETDEKDYLLNQYKSAK